MSERLFGSENLNNFERHTMKETNSQMFRIEMLEYLWIFYSSRNKSDKKKNIKPFDHFQYEHTPPRDRTSEISKTITIYDKKKTFWNARLNALKKTKSSILCD